MAVTLAQAKLLTQDKLVQTVIDEFRKDPLLDLMVFDDCVSAMGNGSTLAYVYNRVTTYPTAGFRALNTEYTPQEAATEQFTSILKVFGGSFQIDRVIQNNVKGVTDQLTFQLEQKIEATKALFADTFINGDSAVDANSYDGLNKAITGSSTELIPSASIDLSSSAAIDANWKVFLDNLRKLRAKLMSDPSAWLVNRDMYSVFQSVADRTAAFTTTKDEFGKEVLRWGQTPIVQVGDKPGTSNPIIKTDDTSGETGIYAACIGLNGVHAVSPAGTSLVSTYLPDFKLPGAVKTGEVEMVAATALKATRGAGVVRKIKIQ
jgi:hypothetical protein